MKLIVAVDDSVGMMFNGRRQSKDVKLREYILKLSANHTLRINSFTAGQFGSVNSNNVIVEENLLKNAHSEDFCFIENLQATPYIKRISAIFLCKWNRAYPRDMVFDIDLTSGWKLNSVEDIAGKSHEKITIEEWIKI